MRNYLTILPVALLVTYSQIIVKKRTAISGNKQILGSVDSLLNYLSDPMIISAYVSALLASIAWLYVVTKLPMTVAFPLYIGITFCLVLLGGWFFLNEAMSLSKLISLTLILSGIVLGIRG